MLNQHWWQKKSSTSAARYQWGYRLAPRLSDEVQIVGTFLLSIIHWNTCYQHFNCHTQNTWIPVIPHSHTLLTLLSHTTKTHAIVLAPANSFLLAANKPPHSTVTARLRANVQPVLTGDEGDLRAAMWWQVIATRFSSMDSSDGISPGEDDFFYLQLYLKRKKKSFNEPAIYVCAACLSQVHIHVQKPNVFSHIKIPQITTEIDCWG